jgi:hypothetical protein
LMERDVTDGGKIMLKWIFKKEDGKARIWLICFTIESCEHGNDPSGSVNSVEYYAIRYTPYRNGIQCG